MKAKHTLSVLQLIDGFATDAASGGAAQFGIQLARRLDKAQFHSHVCGLWQHNVPSEQRWRATLQQEGIETTILIDQAAQLERDLLRAMARLLLVIDRVQPHIINSHFERGDLLGVLCKLIHTAHPCMIRTMHTEQQWQKRPWLGRMLNIGVFPWLCNREVAISLSTKAAMDGRLAVRLGKRRRAIVLYNGIPATLLKQSEARTVVQTTQADTVRVAIIGRIEYQKGHDCLLQAGVLLLQQVPRAEIWIIGTGSLLEDIRRLATTLGIAHAVRFLGQRSDVAEILQQVDLLVSASRWEGFPTVILEAMAARTAVVATDVSGSRELVRNGETGLLVPVDNAVALAQSIIWLIRHPHEARRMVNNAWRHVHQYTLEETTLGYMRLYQAVWNEERGDRR